MRQKSVINGKMGRGDEGKAGGGGQKERKSPCTGGGKMRKAKNRGVSVGKG